MGSKGGGLRRTVVLSGVEIEKNFSNLCVLICEEPMHTVCYEWQVRDGRQRHQRLDHAKLFIYQHQRSRHACTPNKAVTEIIREHVYFQCVWVPLRAYQLDED